MEKVIEALVDFVSKYDDTTLDVIQIVLSAILIYKLRKSGFVVSQQPSTVPAPVQAPTETVTDPKSKTVRSQVKKQMLADLETYFSNIPDDDLTDDQRAAVERVSLFLGD